jgi:Lar family restriction alleviation protein
VTDDKIKMMLPPEPGSEEDRRSACDGLLKCPFCGSDRVSIEQYVTSCNVKCKCCGSEGPGIPNYANGMHQEQAQKAWNKRAC